MHIHLPKPLHGWREFLGEVAIIVIGVLIALGAEQLVETMHWRSEVAKFRQALDNEIAVNLAFYNYRVDQRGCVALRLLELNKWRQMQRDGQAIALSHDVGRPSILTFNTSIWKSRSSELTAHMPDEAERTYAEIYDIFDGLNTQLVEERDAWRSLAAFNGANRLSSDNLMRLSELIYRAGSLDRAIDAANGPGLRADAAKLRIRANGAETMTHVPPPDPDFCKSLLSTGLAK